MAAGELAELPKVRLAVRPTRFGRGYLGRFGSEIVWLLPAASQVVSAGGYGVWLLPESHTRPFPEAG